MFSQHNKIYSDSRNSAQDAMAKYVNEEELSWHIHQEFNFNFIHKARLSITSRLLKDMKS